MKTITKKDVKIRKRKKNSHKGQNGKVLVIGGSVDYVGAVALAGLAALRSGCDYVTIAAPEKVSWAVNCLSKDLVTKKLRGNYLSLRHFAELKELAKGYDVLLIGNGVGLERETGFLINKLVRELDKKFVIDADALKFVKLQDLKNCILTPHAKEMRLLLKNSKLNSKNYKDKLENNIILLKGEKDAIISKKRVVVNKTGNAGMTKAGTGDVLAGLAAGFLAQGLSLFQSSINAAYFNGLAGDILLKKKKGFSYLASDLVDEIKKLV